MPLLTRPILQVEAQREQGLPKVMLLGVLAQEVDLNWHTVLSYSLAPQPEQKARLVFT